jgi:hypothetical protein
MNTYAKPFFLLFLLVSWETIFPAVFPDLQDKVQDFVLEEKQIFIPGYPSAFNPSIVRSLNTVCAFDGFCVAE